MSWVAARSPRPLPEDLSRDTANVPRRSDRPAVSRRDRAPRRSGPRRGRRTLIALLTLVLTAATATVVSHALAAPTAPTPSGWTTVWRDDFNGAAGTGVNTTDWMYVTGTGYPGGAAHFGTGEVETMTSSTANVALDGAGHLAITPVRDAAGTWTSGRIETQRTDFAAPAGGVMRVEASIQQPNVTTADGAGYWPAFWMLGADARAAGATNWPGIGEIDILENVNGRGSAFGTLHCGVIPGGPCNETTGIGSGEHPCAGCQTGFHTYAVEYDRSVSPEQIRWYLDGANYFTLDAARFDAATWARTVHHGFYVILNVAIGGSFPDAVGGGKPNAATVSGKPMLVDYVAVYSTTQPSPGPRTTATVTPSATAAPATTVRPSAKVAPVTTVTSSATPLAGSRDAYGTIRAESSDAQFGTTTETTANTPDGGIRGRINNGDWLLYRNVDFTSTPARQFLASLASGAGSGVSGLVQVRLDSLTSSPISTLEIADTGGWRNWRTLPMNIPATTGRHDVYLTFASGQPADFVNISWFAFGH